MKENKLNRDVGEILEPLRNMPPRDPGKAAAGRAEFLSRAENQFAGMPVSQTQNRRLNGWIAGIITPFKRKERFDMFSILTAVVLTLTVLFGGAGATVYAAQDSLPDDALYSVKTFSEDLRLNLAVDPEGQIDLLLKYADERVEEMAALVGQGEPVPQEVQSRYEKLMGNALQVAAGLKSEQMLKNMGAIQLRAKNQERITKQISVGAGVATQIRKSWEAAIEEQLQILEIGLQDPQAFQNQFQHQFQYQQGLTDTISATVPVSGTFAYQNQFQHQFQHQQGISGTITGTVPITGTQYSPGPQFRPEDPGPGVGPGPGGDDGGTGSGTGSSQGDHDQDSYNQGDNDNSGGSDNGGGTGGDNGGSNGGGNGGGSGGGGG